MIIKLILIIILILILYLLFNSILNNEHFHELNITSPITTTKQCLETSCGVTDYTNEKCSGKTTRYILGKCVEQHTEVDGTFSDAGVECLEHNILSKDTGCKEAANTYWANINTLYNLASSNIDDAESDGPDTERLADKCACRNELEPGAQPNGYSQWVGLD